MMNTVDVSDISAAVSPNKTSIAHEIAWGRLYKHYFSKKKDAQGIFYLYLQSRDKIKKYKNIDKVEAVLKKIFRVIRHDYITQKAHREAFIASLETMMQEYDNAFLIKKTVELNLSEIKGLFRRYNAFSQLPWVNDDFITLLQQFQNDLMDFISVKLPEQLKQRDECILCL